jgi:hypothetical protein
MVFPADMKGAACALYRMHLSAQAIKDELDVMYEQVIGNGKMPSLAVVKKWREEFLTAGLRIKAIKKLRNGKPGGGATKKMTPAKLYTAFKHNQSDLKIENDYISIRRFMIFQIRLSKFVATQNCQAHCKAAYQQISRHPPGQRPDDQKYLPADVQQQQPPQHQPRVEQVRFQEAPSRSEVLSIEDQQGATQAMGPGGSSLEARPLEQNGLHRWCNFLLPRVEEASPREIPRCRRTNRDPPDS